MNEFKEWMLAVSIFMLLITLWVEAIRIIFSKKIKVLEKELIKEKENEKKS